jgi:hypothetical protein
MIQTDFRADLIDHVDDHLARLGFATSGLGEARASAPRYLMLLVRALRRVPSVRARRVFMAPEFLIPDSRAEGFSNLVQAIESGASVRPWLSLKVANLIERDALLDDWGIHHLHLGATPHSRASGFVARTEEVAFAIIRPDAVYFIAANSHNRQKAPLVWTQMSLVDIVHRNWPHLLATNRMRSSGYELTPAQRAALRKHCTNACVTVDDGTVYYAPGGGSMSNGDGGIDYIYQMQLFRELDYRETVVREQEAVIRAALGAGDGELTLKASFEIDYPEGFTVHVVEPTRNVAIQF